MKNHMLFPAFDSKGYSPMAAAVKFLRSGMLNP
jgi:hypothetical protein